MKYPNQYCGECSRWLTYGEPDTSEETNKEIEYYCNNCCEASMYEELRVEHIKEDFYRE